MKHRAIIDDQEQLGVVLFDEMKGANIIFRASGCDRHASGPVIHIKSLSRAMVIFASVFIVAAGLQAQSVATRYGPVKGIIDGGIYRFLGIPFAKPPVGDLRWQPPQELPANSDTIYALAFRDSCPQKRFKQGDTLGVLEGKEDCLHLNIWTPQIDGGSRPVMVFIHGGGNQQGSAGEVSGGTEIYSGKNLAMRGDVVVVTIQYRLGPLGYLVHPGLEPESNGVSGNYGIMDQIQALRWVKENISAFGGDPDKVMVFGESAGGVNVGNLLVSPMASGLFSRACIQSAMPVVSDYGSARQNGIAFVDRFITSGSDAEKIGGMRQIHPDSLTATLTSPVSGGVVQQAWLPVLDGIVFTEKPFSAFESGYFNQVPLMIGSNADEMSLSAPATVTPLMVNLLINQTLSPAYRQKALELYPPGLDNSQARESLVQILTDAQFTAPVRRTARCVSGNQPYPVWRYFFSHRHTIPVLSSYGSYHGMELFYVFNNWENATLGKGNLFKPEDDAVQRQMLAYWVNFARSGNPNGQDLTEWPEYRSQDDCYLEIKSTSNGDQCGLRSEKSDLWDQVAGFEPCSVGELPVILSFQINNGATQTHEREVVLKLEATGNPTHYAAAENFTNLDTNWLPFTSSPSFQLSEAFGLKSVYVKVKNQFGASDTARAIIEYARVTGAKPGPAAELRAFPNPFTKFIYVQNPSGLSYSLEIFSADGKLQAVRSKDGDVLQTESISPGLYFVRLKWHGGSRILKFIKCGY